MKDGRMARARWIAAVALLAAWCALGRADAARRVGVVGEGKPWATAYVDWQAAQPGPTVLVVGGVHGDEPAGARAAGQIAHWTVTRGRLVVVPRANELALRQGKRYTLGEGSRDLNRSFPTRTLPEPRGELAAACWGLMCRVRPTWVVDLHESAGFHRKEPKRFGNSVIHYPEPGTARAAVRMTAAVDATIAGDDRKFVLLRYPASGSLSRAAAERLGAHAMIVETTHRGPPLSLRTRQHRVMVHRLLQDLGMLSGGPDVMCPLVRRNAEMRVALYDGAGAGGRGIPALDKLLRDDPAVRLERVGPAEILAGALAQFDVLICPGGSASGQAKAITRPGREAVRRFVGNGGGYLGICAGAYLAASNYSWSLAILDADVIDRAHWKRGTGVVPVEQTAEGHRVLGRRPDPFEVRYANGPLFAAAERPDVPDYRVLARFRGEIAKNGAPRGVMVGTPALLAGRWGKGRVLVSSPHPESTQGLSPELIRRAILWTAGRTDVEAN